MNCLLEKHRWWYRYLAITHSQDLWKPWFICPSTFSIDPQPLVGTSAGFSLPWNSQVTASTLDSILHYPEISEAISYINLYSLLFTISINALILLLLDYQKWLGIFCNMRLMVPISWVHSPELFLFQGALGSWFEFCCTEQCSLGKGTIKSSLADVGKCKWRDGVNTWGHWLAGIIEEVTESAHHTESACPHHHLHQRWRRSHHPLAGWN